MTTRTKLIQRVFMALLVAMAGLVPFAAHAQTGVVTGTVTDAQTGEPLPGANLRIEGTAIGTATGLEGDYRLTGVPVGSQTLVASYIGYETVTYPITVTEGQAVRQDAQINMTVFEGEGVIVTAQLEGQARAINQQLSSNTIVNIVSSDRIQELPDQNAAESIGRLPGISVQRNAGEGQKVVVRGLSPKFNSITINGERIPSTDPEDRSVDLSLISPDVLAGIEVFKALTPDKDGDAIGGTVNLVSRRAPDGFQGNIRGQTGYSSNADAFGQYRGSVSLSNRFFGSKLGVLATGSLQRADRSSDVFSAAYEFRREGSGEAERGVVGIENLNLADRLETRDRYSASLALDYELPGGEVLLNSFFARTERDELRTRKRYRVGAFRTEYDLRDRQLFTNLLTNSLSGRHTLPFAELTWRTSLSNTLQKQPYAHYARFQELGAFENGLIDDKGPAVIPNFARNDLASTWLQYATFNPERTQDRNLTAQFDLNVPLTIGADVAGYVKFGAKYRAKQRRNDLTEYRTPFGETDAIGKASPDQFTLYRNTHISIDNFLDPDYEVGEFLNGQYEFGPALDVDKLGTFYDTYAGRYQLNRYVELSDYEAGEAISAGYVMAEINVGHKLMVLPGARYEWTTNDYDGKVGQLREDLGAQGAIEDTTGGQSYGELLPMVHLRYKFTPNLDIRLAVTRTLSRPDYFNLVPFEQVNDAEQTVRRGNPNLKHTTAWNYDAFVSFYNRFGLLTVGAYYKELRNIDYLKQNFRVQEGPYANYTMTEPTNADESTVYGVEVDLQTNLRFLPSPLDGVVLSANVAYIHSETFFPLFEIGPRSPDPPYRPTIIDTVRVGRLPGQAARIANLSLGYEKGGFSGRISMIYQGESLAAVGSRSELDGFTDAFVRWDASLSQRIPLRGLRLFLNVNNLSDQPEASYLGSAAYPTNEEFFGWTADLGLRYDF